MGMGGDDVQLMACGPGIGGDAGGTIFSHGPNNLMNSSMMANADFAASGTCNLSSPLSLPMLKSLHRITVYNSSVFDEYQPQSA